MLNRPIIKKGLRKGVIRLIPDPNLESGTVCAIGTTWFYFGGQLADSLSPFEYQEKININTIASKIYFAIKDLKLVSPDEYQYIITVLKDQISFNYTAVQCSTKPNKQGFYIITGTLAPKGTITKQLAVLDDVTGRICYLDDVAKTDPEVQACVRSLLKTRPNKLLVEKEPDAISMSFDTPKGRIYADFEPSVLTHANHETVYVSFEPHPTVGIVDLASVEISQDTININAWTNIFDPECTKSYQIKDNEIQELIDEYKENEHA